ncbi:MAG: hypothetical protein ACFFAS_01050 [Promethearchaeota archaeon]
MEFINHNFEEGASSYDDKIPNIIPYYDIMLNAVVSSIPFDSEEQINVLELGSGTGNLTKKIK